MPPKGRIRRLQTWLSVMETARDCTSTVRFQVFHSAVDRVIKRPFLPGLQDEAHYKGVDLASFCPVRVPVWAGAGLLVRSR
jgi:hypothetical protein